MAGVKGRSGRRTKSEEEKRREVLQLAWTLHYQYLSSADVKLADKIRYANPILLKCMVEHIENRNLNFSEEKKKALDNYFVELFKGRNLPIEEALKEQNNGSEALPEGLNQG
jgi:hypothetical protein